VTPPALTLWYEWAFAVSKLDKRVENRTWNLPPAMIGATVYLHAGAEASKPVRKRRAKEVVQMAERAGWRVIWKVVETYRIDVEGRMVKGNVVVPLTGGRAYGCIIGKMTFTGCDAPGEGDLTGWRVPELYGWRFEYEPLMDAIPQKGALGFWRPTVAVEGA
jgi:hypothetical protein